MVHRCVDARKQFETRQKQMQVWEALSRNKELVISGESHEELNAMMLCDAIMEGTPGGSDTKSAPDPTHPMHAHAVHPPLVCTALIPCTRVSFVRSAILAEMLVMQRGSKVMLNMSDDKEAKRGR